MGWGGGSDASWGAEWRVGARGGWPRATAPPRHTPPPQRQHALLDTEDSPVQGVSTTAPSADRPQRPGPTSSSSGVTPSPSRVRMSLKPMTAFCSSTSSSHLRSMKELTIYRARGRRRWRGELGRSPLALELCPHPPTHPHHPNPTQPCPPAALSAAGWPRRAAHPRPPNQPPHVPPDPTPPHPTHRRCCQLLDGLVGQPLLNQLAQLGLVAPPPHLLDHVPARV